MNYLVSLLLNSAILLCGYAHATDSKIKTFTTKQLQANFVQHKAKKSAHTIHDDHVQGIQPDEHIKRSPSSSAFSTGLNFTAATQVNSWGIDFEVTDQNGWVGPEQYVMMSFMSIQSFDKKTGQPDGVLNLDASPFFQTDCDDVRITYNRFMDRWIMVAQNFIEPNGPATEVLIIWSDSGIITPDTIWTLYTFTNEQLVPDSLIPPADRPAAVDYPVVTSDVNAVYITIDTFDLNTGAFIGSTFIVMPNSSFISGNPFNFTIFPGNLGPTFAFFSGEISPSADNFDPEATFGYAVNLFYNNPDQISGTVIKFFRIVNPGSASPTLSAPIDLIVPYYANGAAAAFIPPFVPNPFGTCPHKGNLYGDQGFLETSYYISVPHVRNKQLYMCYLTNLDSNGDGDIYGDRIGVRWHQFDLTGDPTGQGQGTETETTVPALVQTGTLFDSATINPKFYTVPAIMTNKNNDLVIEATTSSAVDFINVVYASRKATDPLGTLRDPVLLTNNPGNPYNYGTITLFKNQRWGDLTSLCPDPSNDLDIWSTGEWAALNNGWGIQTTQLIPVS